MFKFEESSDRFGDMTTSGIWTELDLDVWVKGDQLTVR